MRLSKLFLIAKKFGHGNKINWILFFKINFFFVKIDENEIIAFLIYKAFWVLNFFNGTFSLWKASHNGFSSWIILWKSLLLL